LRVTLLILLLAVGTLGLTHQAPVTPDNSFRTFWTQFKQAVAKNDKQAVASLTVLPFMFDSKERDRTGFIRIYPRLFNARTRRCIARAKPVPEGEDYEIFCGQTIFYFARVDGRYRFREIGVND
jgi:hypothetical protein